MLLLHYLYLSPTTTPTTATTATTMTTATAAGTAAAAAAAACAASTAADTATATTTTASSAITSTTLQPNINTRDTAVKPTGMLIIHNHQQQHQRSSIRTIVILKINISITTVGTHEQTRKNSSVLNMIIMAVTFSGSKGNRAKTKPSTFCRSHARHQQRLGGCRCAWCRSEGRNQGWWAGIRLRVRDLGQAWLCSHMMHSLQRQYSSIPEARLDGFKGLGG